MRPHGDEAAVGNEAAGVNESAGVDKEEAVDEDEFERQCFDAERPDHRMDTDDEWDAYDEEERVTARAKYTKDKTNYDVKLCRWGASKLAAICSHEKCNWKIYCSSHKRTSKWIVQTYVNTHNHGQSGKAKMLKQGVIAIMFRDEARRRPGLRWTDIKDEIMMRYTLYVSKWICQKARRIALDMVITTQKEQFAKLWDYEAELKRSNPNTHTEIVTIPQASGKQQFDKFYICFDASRRKWKSCCRPIIELDGSFLKWELKGEILAAVGRDADNRIYPIAWAIVRVEDNDSWAWFVEKLKKDLDLGLGSGLTVISDKQKGELNVVANLLPNAEHRHCSRHIYANWRNSHGDYSHEGYFWAIACSPVEGDYQFNMRDLKAYDEAAHDDLLKTEPHTWCRAFFKGHFSCEDVCNNLSESFNRTIKDARKKPVINMLEDVRRQAMKRISKRRDKTGKCQTGFPPHIMAIVEANRKHAKFCSVLKSSYEVLEGSGSFLVNLLCRSCACNQWNLTGIPSTIVIQKSNYVDRKFLTTVWQANYKDNIKPVNGERLWIGTDKGAIEVPDKRKKCGRPKKFARIKEPGHNKGTCKNAAVQPDPTRKKGRPRKRLDNDDPWSIHNAPKRWQQAQSQSTPTVSQTQSTEQPQHSSAPAVGRGRARGHPSGTKNGEGKGRVKARGKGRGKGSDEAPKPPVFLMSPWTDKVIDVWQPKKN
ncbi:PREDICTED: uncharacterized protein LOC104743919 [Camelina sativa]|uniref:Uncharacterized protein LOC104743919 n=1 Tax=Camelina sativa TaxID=90675 RepID=A0ABM0VYU2_CAMSA|nr:PREDICTED: uncharacterized protein LOC104743919 [Camelina sativa]